jgi:hypothetical protein
LAGIGGPGGINADPAAALFQTLAPLGILGWGFRLNIFPPIGDDCRRGNGDGMPVGAIIGNPASEEPPARIDASHD